MKYVHINGRLGYAIADSCCIDIYEWNCCCTLHKIIVVFSFRFDGNTRQKYYTAFIYHWIFTKSVQNTLETRKLSEWAQMHSDTFFSHSLLLSLSLDYNIDRKSEIGITNININWFGKVEHISFTMPPK